MVFKKGDLKTKEAARKSGHINWNKHSDKMTANLQKSTTRGKPDVFRHFNRNQEHQSKAGKMSKIWENKKAEELNKEYSDVFQPSAVCDRICFQNGVLSFVEIKRKKKRYGQELSEKQQKFRELCETFGYNYVVVYI